jgi:hypothetical protein
MSEFGPSRHLVRRGNLVPFGQSQHESDRRKLPARDPKRRFGVRLYCNAARECPTMAARCTTRPFH